MDAKLSIEALTSELNQEFLDRLIAVFGQTKVKITVEEVESVVIQPSPEIATQQKLLLKEKLKKGLAEVDEIIKGSKKGTSLDEFFGELEEEVEYAK